MHATGVQPRTVLVVEDDAAISEVVAAALHDEGYRVLLAGDGARALDLLQRARGAGGRGHRLAGVHGEAVRPRRAAGAGRGRRLVPGRRRLTCAGPEHDDRTRGGAMIWEGPMEGVFEKVARWAGRPAALGGEPTRLGSGPREGGTAGRLAVRLVRDDGHALARGDRVAVYRTRSAPAEWHAVKDDHGTFEVLGCSPVPAGRGDLLQVILRVVESA
jgi:CheY-like chemotaxis protein